MKLTGNQKMVVGLLIVLGIVYYFRPSSKQGGGGAAGGFTVYGTDWCGYTTKQRKHLDSKYGANSHTYVNCDTADCPGMDGFPVTKLPSGKKVSGFNDSL